MLTVCAPLNRTSRPRTSNITSKPYKIVFQFLFSFRVCACFWCLRTFSAVRNFFPQTTHSCTCETLVQLCICLRKFDGVKNRFEQPLHL